MKPQLDKWLEEATADTPEPTNTSVSDVNRLPPIPQELPDVEYILKPWIRTIPQYIIFVVTLVVNIDYFHLHIL